MSEVNPTPTLSPENLNELRTRVLAGEELSQEEYREVIRAYRAARQAGVSAAAPKAKAKAASAAKAAPVALDDLFKGLGL